MSTTTTDQHMHALGIANEMRYAKADLRREIGALPYNDALRQVADLIEGEDAVIGAFRLAEALSACPKLGAISAGRFVRRIGAVTGDRRVRDLTPRQRASLVAALRDPVASGTRGALAAQAAITNAVAPKRPPRSRPTPLTSRRAPTRPASNDRAERLYAAITEHHRHVSSPSCTAEDFGQADARLWDAAMRITGKRVGRREMAA